MDGGAGVDWEGMVRDISDALAGVFSKVQRGYTTKWVLVTEAIDEDGDYGLWTVGSDDTKPWDVLGMLTHALTSQKGEIMRVGGDPRED